MKILFYDGSIRRFSRPTNIKYHFPIDASNGYSSNLEDLQSLIKDFNGDPIVLTNSLVALDHRYGWNEKENHTDIYFYVESKHDFVRCDELTEREIREGHNIMKMFLNREFDLE
jgi:hypothetical protein